MRALGRLLLLLLVLLLVGPPVLVLWALDTEPRVVAAETLSQADIERARKLLKEHDPRRLEAGEIRSLTLTQKEINLLLRYGLGRLLPVTARTRLGDGAFTVDATLTVPANPLGRYLNATAQLELAAGRPRLAGLDLGGIPIPSAAARLLWEGAHHLLSRHDLYRRALAAVNGVRVEPQRLRLVYQWEPGLVDEARAAGRRLLLSGGEEDRLLAYHRRLADVTGTVGRGTRVPLTRLMAPLFRLAQTRTAEGGAAAQENRSLITVLALYVQGADVPRLVGAPGAPEATATVPQLRGRRDLAQHFLISAGIAVLGGEGLADAVGLLKEVDDSRHGSGFSFTDLAADRAGVRFAEQATGPPAAARRVQSALARGARGDDILPSLEGLPEFMSEAELRRRYGEVGSPAYRRVVRDIESRIAALPLYGGER